LPSANDNPIDLLRRYESRNITFVDPAGDWPIVWDRASGVHVTDNKGRRYLDLTAAFGVAAAGHANPRVVRAGQSQMARLCHAMGDVHPHAGKALLARELSRLTFERWTSSHGKTIFCNSGFEAVEAALKTALLATGRPQIISLDGAYHGLGHGALNATQRPLFRAPFATQLGNFGRTAPFPSDAASMRSSKREINQLLKSGQIGAVLIEPVQGRGGIRVPHPDFLPWLRKTCDRHGALLILDEIYTGFGRTGRWFACEHSDVAPDLICLGKALSGGFPISACVGRASLMDDAWPASDGEAIHTSTFLGHPVGCAMALENLREISRLNLPARANELGQFCLRALADIRHPQLRLRPIGLGLMLGLEMRHPDGSPSTEPALHIMKRMLHRGFILLPEGDAGNVLGIIPPLTITRKQLQRAVDVLKSEIENLRLPAT
jgi:4-aminobutyrate aminotransferase-like enzyme